MRKATIPVAAVILSCAFHASAQQRGPQRAAPESDPIQAAADAIGAVNLRSVRFTGLGANFSVGQSPNPTAPWPRVTIKSYDAAINFDAASMRVELVREQGSIPPRGGGLPFTGEQRFIEFVNGNHAWNVRLLPPPLLHRQPLVRLFRSHRFRASAQRHGSWNRSPNRSRPLPRSACSRSGSHRTAS